MKIYDYENVHKLATNNTCKFMYIGSFYNKIREPQYMLEVLYKVSNRIDGFEMHLYGPSPDSIPAIYKEQFGDKLHIHGRVSKEEVLTAIDEADFFINIGNSINNQLPSKVLEYIGTGKPIINFYSIIDDTSNKYLEKYTTALLIKQDDNYIEENERRILKFINKVKGIKVSKDEIMKIYEDDTIEAVKEKLLMILG